MFFYYFALICFWAVSVTLSFMLGKGKKGIRKARKKQIPNDSLHIKRIKEMEKQFWHYNGKIQENNEF